MRIHDERAGSVVTPGDGRWAKSKVPAPGALFPDTPKKPRLGGDRLPNTAHEGPFQPVGAYSGSTMALLYGSSAALGSEVRDQLYSAAI